MKRGRSTRSAGSEPQDRHREIDAALECSTVRPGGGARFDSRNGAPHTPLPRSRRPMQLLTSPQDYDALCELPLVLVYKHSARCPISLIAYQEVAQLEGDHPDVPIY